MLIDLIAGARPNFMKIAPIIDAIKLFQNRGYKIVYRLIHTGQHFDKNMSDTFFKQLGIPEPDVRLGATGSTPAEQTASIMIAYEKLLFEQKSDLCLVVGDVTSTMACAIVAQKLFIKVAHVEAGIRSGDWTMPEEINRLVTDSISNYFFTTTDFASKALLTTGIDSNRIFFVGNTMIDTLLKNRNKFQKPFFWEKHDLSNNQYLVLTLHRPSNVDDEINLRKLIQEVISSSDNSFIIFPVHPRTLKVLKKLDISNPKLIITEPLGYLEFNFLVERAKCVITDSGGITEETTVMGIPCLTLRDTTERPETVELGTNELLGTNPDAIKPALVKVFNGNWKKGQIPSLWDGKAAERIIQNIVDIFALA